MSSSSSLRDVESEQAAEIAMLRELESDQAREIALLRDENARLRRMRDGDVATLREKTEMFTTMIMLKQKRVTELENQLYASYVPPPSQDDFYVRPEIRSSKVVRTKEEIERQIREDEAFARTL